MPPGASPPPAWLTRRASRAGWVAPATWVGHCGVGAFEALAAGSIPIIASSALDAAYQASSRTRVVLPFPARTDERDVGTFGSVAPTHTGTASCPS